MENTFLATNPLSSALRDLLTRPGDTLTQWRENVTTKSMKPAKILGMNDYIQLVAIVLGYLLLRPYLTAWGEKSQQKKLEKEEQEAARKKAEAEQERSEERKAAARDARRRGAGKDKAKDASDARSASLESDEGAVEMPADHTVREVDVLEIEEERRPGEVDTEERREARRKRKEVLRTLVLESEMALLDCLQDDEI